MWRSSSFDAPHLNGLHLYRKTSGQFTFADRAHLIAAGEQAALQMLPEIRAAFANPSVIRR